MTRERYRKALSKIRDSWVRDFKQPKKSFQKMDQTFPLSHPARAPEPPLFLKPGGRVPAGLWDLGIFIFSILFYVRTLGYGFVWDDFAQIVHSSALREFDHLGRFFTTPYWVLLNGAQAPYHRPLFACGILLGSVFSGAQPWGYHLLSLLLQGGIAVMFSRVLRRLEVPGSVRGLAVILFCVHPVLVESVAWISSSGVLWSALFFLISLDFLSSARQGRLFRRTLFRGLALAAYAAALLAYPSVWTTPVLVFFWQRLGGRLPFREALRDAAGYWVLLGLYGAYAFWVFRAAGYTDYLPHYHPELANVIYAGRWSERLLAPFNLLGRSIEHLIFPLNLAPDAWFQAGAIPVSAAAALILFGALSRMLFKSTSASPLAALAVCWILIPLLPVSGLVRAGGLFSDRYLYLSSMGFALWTALVLHHLRNWLASRQPPRPVWAIVMAGALVTGYAAKTWVQVPVWKNEIVFWYEASRVTPGKARIHHKLGMALEDAGLYAEAVKAYRRVYELAPDAFVFTPMNLARVYQKMGRDEEARRWLEIQKASPAGVPGQRFEMEAGTKAPKTI